MRFKLTTLGTIVVTALLFTGCGAQPPRADLNTQSLDPGGREEFEPYKNDRFTRALTQLFDQGSDSNTQWSVSIRAFGPRGQKLSLYKQQENKAVKPASTMKVLTSWTAFQKIPSASQVGTEKYSYIREMMKYSDNGMAENVLSWCGGLASSYAMLSSFGIEKSSQLKIADGSGLSYDNRLAAQDLVQLLTKARATDKIKAFRSLFPVAGIDGTLAGRMGHLKGTIAAKTGTLTTDPTTALAGYGDSRTGWQIVFAILGDSVPSVDSGRATIDAAVEEVINTLNYLPASSEVAAN